MPTWTWLLVFPGMPELDSRSLKDMSGPVSPFIPTLAVNGPAAVVEDNGCEPLLDWTLARPPLLRETVTDDPNAVALSRLVFLSTYPYARSSSELLKGP